MTEKRPEPATPFGKWVAKVLDEHGMSLRGQRRRTGLAHSTITNWLDGVKPGMAAVIDFARGFGEDVNDALLLAGYEALPEVEPAADDYDRAIQREYRAMKERLAADGIATMDKGSHHGGSAGLTAADAVDEIAELERLLRKYAEKG